MRYHNQTEHLIGFLDHVGHTIELRPPATYDELDTLIAYIVRGVVINSDLQENDYQFHHYHTYRKL